MFHSATPCLVTRPFASRTVSRRAYSKNSSHVSGGPSRPAASRYAAFTYSTGTLTLNGTQYVLPWTVPASRSVPGQPLVSIPPSASIYGVRSSSTPADANSAISKVPSSATSGPPPRAALTMKLVARSAYEPLNTTSTRTASWLALYRSTSASIASPAGPVSVRQNVIVRTVSSPEVQPGAPQPA